jgi:hypothetical protein
MWIAAALLVVASTTSAQQVDPALFGALKWRLIGPFRAGRVSAGAVDPVDPHTYYFGAAGGGVWKSTNDGHGRGLDWRDRDRAVQSRDHLRRNR